MNNDLMLAILAMDAYNRKRPSSDTTVDIEVEGTALGFWNLSDRRDEYDSNFYAQAYSYGGQIVISYRGTDSFFGDMPDWVTGGGAYLTDQTILAAQFYRSIATEHPLSQITLTGHSLGGGLAGFVGSIYGVSGVLFDNMPFELAADSLYQVTRTTVDENGNPIINDPAARQEFYNGQEPSPISMAGLRGYAVEGEFLGTFRSAGQITPVTLLDPHTSWGDAFTQLHKQALLVILLYAKHIADTGGVPERTWTHLADQLIPSLFNEELAEAIGAGSVQGEDAPFKKMLAMIAYSAIDEGTRPFGDSAIRALFDDANELGDLLSQANVSQPLRKLSPPATKPASRVQCRLGMVCTAM